MLDIPLLLCHLCSVNSWNSAELTNLRSVCACLYRCCQSQQFSGSGSTTLPNMARNLTPPTENVENSTTLCFLSKRSKKSENSPNYAIGRITQKLSFGRIPKNIPAALNRVIKSTLYCRYGDFDAIYETLSQAILLCTRILFFEIFNF